MIKGQAYNVVQSLKHHDEGPLELTRRQNVLVWDDELVVPDDETDSIRELLTGPLSASAAASISPNKPTNSNPFSLSLSPSIAPPFAVSALAAPAMHRRSLSHSALDLSQSHSQSQNGGSGGGRHFLGFPPPARRRRPRPVPFASKLPRVHPGTTGVTVLEHMERVDAVEERLRRLAIGEDGEDGEAVDGDGGEGGGEGLGQEREVDIGVARPSASGSNAALGVSRSGSVDERKRRKRPETILEGGDDGEEEQEDEDGQEEDIATPTVASPLISPISPSISLPADEDRPPSLSSSMTEDDLAAGLSGLSMSTGALPRPSASGAGGGAPSLFAPNASLAHLRIASTDSQTSGSGRAGLEWIREEEEGGRRRVVINEVCGVFLSPDV